MPQNSDFKGTQGGTPVDVDQTRRSVKSCAWGMTEDLQLEGFRPISIYISWLAAPDWSETARSGLPGRPGVPEIKFARPGNEDYSPGLGFRVKNGISDLISSADGTISDHTGGREIESGGSDHVG